MTREADNTRKTDITSKTYVTGKIDKALRQVQQGEQGSKPGGLDVETNRDRDRERPSCRD